MEMAAQPDKTPSPTAPDGTPVPVVAIGASAGGVQALISFFAHLPPDANMAFVVILHLPLESERNLAAIVQGHTAMPVLPIAEQMPLNANHVYIMPPNAQLSVTGGLLRLHPFETPNNLAMPIDQCFRAIADAYPRRSAAIILTGAGSDGANGIRRIKEAGGVTLVQDPQDAQFNSMPRMAISTGLVDFVLPATALPDMLVTYWRRSAAIETPPVEDDAQILRDIFALLRTRTSHDFSHYKRPTIQRRLARRMQVTGATDLSAYLALLRSGPDEVQALLHDLLISVTNFFRDRDAWVTLQTVIPQFFANKGPADQVRVWVTACATGEEAYSVAMLLREFADTLDQPPAIQVFATDINDQTIAIARQGIYPDSIAGDVSPARLARFFVPDQGGYRIRQDLRDLVLFARHNVLHDPPFSQVDLITCRNLLIYLTREAQDQVIQTFQFALRPQGYLLLGSAESLDGTIHRFATIDKRHRVFRRRPGPTAPPPIASVPISTAPRPAPLPVNPERSQPIASFGELHQRLISPYIPPSVIVDENGEIVHLGRGVSPFLHLGEGEPSHNVLKVVQPSLRPDLRRALFLAREHGQGVDVRRVQVAIDGETRLVNVMVEPIVEPPWARGHLLVLFQDVGVAYAPAEAADSDAEALITQLEADLEHANSELRLIAQQYETVVAEYKAANEELHAINQELRAASEDLETSREEVQSVNEELTTVNQELKLKVEEVSHAHYDLQNLMTSTQIATLFLDRDLRIKRFTPSAKQIFNLIPADLGRPLNHVTHTLRYDGVMQDAAGVLSTREAISHEVETSDDTWYLLRIHPYRTLDDQIDGVVLTFVDITERRRDEEERRQAEAQQRAILNSARQSIMLIAPDYTLLRFNRYAAEAAVTMFGTEMQIGHSFVQYVTPDDRDDFMAHFGQALAGKEISIEKQIHGIAGSDWWEFFYYPIRLATGEVTGVTLTSRNIGERKRAEEALRESEEKYRTLFDTMAEGFTICGAERDADGQVVDLRYLEVNRALEQQTGLDSQTLIGRKLSEVLPRADMEGWVSIYAAALGSGEPVAFEEYVALLDRWFAVSAYPRKGDELAVFYRDITQRKQREQRQEFLLKLSDTLRAEPNADAVANRALHMLSEQLRLDRCYIAVYRLEVNRADFTHQAGNDRVPPLPEGGIRLSDFPEAFRVVFDRTLVIDDFAETEGLSDTDRRNIGALGLRALVAATLRKGENNPHWVIVAVSAAPRRWTQGEVALVEEVTERTWAAVERARAEEALRESEEKYRSLFTSIDEGFNLLEMISDESGHPADFRIVETNPAWEQQTGLTDATGKTLLEIAPNFEQPLLDFYSDVVISGSGSRTEYYTASTDRWYTVYASRNGGEGSRHVAVVFNDITERKRREINVAFLDEIGKDLSLLSTPDDIIQTVGERLEEFLHVSGCIFADVDEAKNEATIHHGWNTTDVPSLKQTFRLADYFGEEFARAGRAGATVIVRDTARDERANAEAYARLNLGGFVTVPFQRHGRWTANITVTSREPRDWRADEIELLQEIASRVFPRIERARAEEALRESEARHRTLFDAVDEGVCLIERLPLRPDGLRDYRYIAMNPAMQAMFGVPDLSRQSIRDNFPNEVEDWYDDYDRVLETGEAIRFERETAPQGMVLEMFVTRVEDGSGQQLLAVMQDVTERKQREAQQAYLLKLTDALRPLSDAVEIEATVTHLALDYFQADRCYYCEIEGDKAIIRRDAARDGLPSVANVYPLGSMPIFKAVVDKGSAFVVENASTTDLMDEELRQLCMEMQVISFIDVPVIKHGQPVGVLCITQATPREWTNIETELAQEIAERTWAAVERARAEAALRESEARLRALIENLPGGAVFVVDRDLRYVLVEGAALASTNTDPQTLLGKTISEAIAPESLGAYESFYRRALAGQSFELEHTTSDRTFMTRGTPLCSSNGDISAVLAISYDITERKQVEDALARAYAAEHIARAEAEAALHTREQFLSIASHELRTPLTSLIGYAYILRTTAHEHEPTTRMTEMIMRQAQRLNTLIDQLLDVSRLQRGQFAIERHPIDLALVVAQVVDEFRATLPPATVHRVELIRPDAPIVMAGDAQRLEQVILNLLSNAVKYSPAGGPIQVRVQRTPTAAVVEVTDQGIGIPQDAQAHVFDAFYRASNVGSQASGFGLGLHIVGEIVQRHGGRIEVESTEGVGSTFRVVLPTPDAVS